MMRRWREALLGPAYYSHRQLLRRSHAWSRQQVNDYLESKKAQLGGFYDRHVVSKSDIMRNPQAHESPYLRFLTYEATTGGTSGTPFRFTMDAFSRRQKERAYIFDMWREIGYRPFDLRVVVRGNIAETLLRYSRFENAHFVSPALMTPANRERLRSFLASLAPFFIHCYPSSLLQFIPFVGDDFFRQLPIRGIMAGSESFPSGQMRWIREDYGLPISHWYGHSEYAVLAKYCSGCSGFHFYPTYGLAEFLEDPGSPFRKIVATSYNRIGTRFMRYDTEDLALVSDTTCEVCNFPRVDSIVGRNQEFFIDKNGQRVAFGPFLFGIHGDFWTKINDIQFVHERPGEMVVLIVPGEDGHRDSVEKFLTVRFKPVSLVFRYVDTVEKTGSVKHRYFVNRC